MRILGIDPGYAILGYGVLDMKGNKFEVIAYGSILTDNSMEMPQRLKLLYDELSEIIRRYQPEEASIEELFFNNNAKTAILVGEARGGTRLRTGGTCYQRVYAAADQTGAGWLRQSGQETDAGDG